MNVIDKLDARELKSDLPELRPGDTVQVHVRVNPQDFATYYNAEFRFSKGWSSRSRAAVPARR